MEEKPTTQLSEELTNNPRHYQKIIYKYCKENYPGIVKMAKVFIDHVKEDFDNHVSVEGGTGSGKSAYTFLLVNVMHELINRSFSIKKHCLFIPNEGELKSKVNGLERFGVFWLDEAIRALDKKRWYNSDQIDLNHTVKTERWRNNTIFYNIQRFAELTESFRNDNIYFRVFIVKKHAAILYVKDEDKDIEDPWHIRENISIKYKKKFKSPRYGEYYATRYNALISVEDRVRKERKLPNYFMDSLFPNPAEIPGAGEYWQYYKNLKELSREKAKEKAEEAKDKKNLNTYEKKHLGIVLTLLKEAKEEGLTATEWYNQRKGTLNITKQSLHRYWRMMLEEERATQKRLTPTQEVVTNARAQESINNTNKENQQISQT